MAEVAVAGASGYAGQETLDRLEIGATGAAPEEEAVAVARPIATSPLVKTAAFGHDPNWGRVIAAAGSAPWNGGFARIDVDRLSAAFDDTLVFDRGTPTGVF